MLSIVPVPVLGIHLISNHNNGPFRSICNKCNIYGRRYRCRTMTPDTVPVSMEESCLIQGFITLFHCRSSRIWTEIMESRTLHCRSTHLLPLLLYRAAAQETCAQARQLPRNPVGRGKKRGTPSRQTLKILIPCPEQHCAPK